MNENNRQPGRQSKRCLQNKLQRAQLSPTQFSRVYNTSFLKQGHFSKYVQFLQSTEMVKPAAFAADVLGISESTLHYSLGGKT